MTHLPAYPLGQIRCSRPSCPGPASLVPADKTCGKRKRNGIEERLWFTAIGEAGGGYGPYTYCQRCSQLLDKSFTPKEIS